jgi:predicted oxidoreductase
MAAILGLMRCGTWGANLTPQALVELIEASLDIGIDTLDLADIYGDHTTNALLGAAFARCAGLKHRVKLVAKIGIVMPTSPINQMNGVRRVQYYDASPQHLQHALDETRCALGVEHVHMLMLHRPDVLMQPEQLGAWLQQQQLAGSVGALGVSNFDASALALLAPHVRIAAHQIELSLGRSVALTDGTHSASRMHGATVHAWSPLGGGALLDQATPVGQRLASVLAELSAEFNQDSASLALRWVASVPGTQVVLGSHRIERLRAAVNALATPLPHAAWYALWQAARGAPVA